ncbi:MAG: glycosyltransferase family 4 protein [Chloroflexi bacterium]|nr:glycosyltransferase family 4 protein [Chloroflexota bacterium]
MGRHAAAVLSTLASDRDLPCRLLSLNDQPRAQRIALGELSLTVEGFGRDKMRFARAALALTPHTRVAYVGHPNLATLGLLLRLAHPTLRYWVATHGLEVWVPLPITRCVGLRLARGVTAPSRFTADAVRRQRFRPRNVQVVPWGLEPGFGHAAGLCGREALAPASALLLLAVTRLEATERYKGVDTLIRAFPAVLRAVPRTYLVIVGDGNDRPWLQRLAQERGVADRVRFVGSVQDGELASYYRACDVFVMPSQKEGFGLVFLEAAAFGKPVVGGNHGGTPEIVQDGVTGFLVEHGDIGALADRVICLLQSSELRARMGEAGRQRVEENYLFRHFSGRLTHLLLEGEPCAS